MGPGIDYKKKTRSLKFFKYANDYHYKYFGTSMCLDQPRSLAYSVLMIKTHNIDIISARVPQQNNRSDLSGFL